MTDKEVSDAVKKSIQIDAMMRDIQEVKYRLNRIHDTVEYSHPRPTMRYRAPREEPSWFSRYWDAIKTDPFWDFLKKSSENG